ncbi:MAG: sulfotransferase [Sphingomonadaceae bacterium]
MSVVVASQPVARDALDAEAIEQELRAARALLQQARFQAAIAACEAVLQSAPGHRDALYTLAVAQRYGGERIAALATLTQLIETDPAYGRAYQERGHGLRALGRAEEALLAYQNAVTHNASLVASWRAIVDLHADAGRPERADYAREQCAYLGSLPPELLTVSSMIAEGRILKAETLCRAYLQKHGHDVEAMRLLADIGMRFNAYDEAEFLLESCVMIEPDGINAHLDYVKVLRKRQKFAAALDQATALRAKAPDTPQVEMLYANENLAVGNFDVALEVYRELLAGSPNNPGINLTMGHALKTVGQQDAAIAAYRRAFSNKPDYGDAFWSLANLKTYRFPDSEIAQMRSAEAAPATTLSDRYHLCFALGKALEDRGDYGPAFAYYERGNRLKREEVRYDWRRISDEIALQIEHCGPELFAACAGVGCPVPDPIFIVGLPRAGSTLLEQILASHSQIEGTMELPNILALAHRLDGRRRIEEEARYPANLGELTADELAGFGEAFIRDTAIHRKAGMPFFIDKMPNNFRHIGLIHLILPNARIIDARRGAMGCCFSGFKQLFAEGQEFTYGLEEIGHYYRDYVRLIDHWDTVLPGKVLRVRYEDVVADLEPQVRRILDFIGVPFEESCINFYANERAVRTASSEQVRQPIFTSGLEQWEKFAPWLDPLRAVLGPELQSR